MKLKYYLKGFGIGVIFTTLVLSISFYVRKNENKSISRQEVESLALAYGMIYPEENTEEIQQDGSGESVLMRETETDQETETVQNSESNEETETTEESETDKETETVQNVQNAETTIETVSETAEEATTVIPESTTEDITTAAPENSLVELRTITIVSGMDASAVARLLEASGIIEDGEGFNSYLIESGYTKRIRTGTYTFAVGTDFETIAEEFTRVPKWR